MITNNSETVRQLISEGQSPFLAFERDVLSAELSGLGVEQRELSRLLGEAMDQSSETWHDNAPAEAVTLQSRILASRAGKLIGELNTAVLLNYPKNTEHSVTLGSIIQIRRLGQAGLDSLLLTGLCRDLPDIQLHDMAFVADISATTVRSPLGGAVLGSEVGEEVSFTVGRRTHKIEVVRLEQFTSVQPAL